MAKNDFSERPRAGNRKDIVKLSVTKDDNYCNYHRRKLLFDIQVECLNLAPLPRQNGGGVVVGGGGGMMHKYRKYQDASI